MAKHDEGNDLKRLNAVGVRIDYSNKQLKVRKDQIIGIKQLGRIDYLTKYCGWVLIYENSIVVKQSNNEEDANKSNKHKRQQKQSKKQNRELFV